MFNRIIEIFISFNKKKPHISVRLFSKYFERKIYFPSATGIAIPKFFKTNSVISNLVSM